jgi:hypothetical protein
VLGTLTKKIQDYLIETARAAMPDLGFRAEDGRAMRQFLFVERT